MYLMIDGVVADVCFFAAPTFNCFLSFWFLSCLPCFCVVGFLCIRLIAPSMAAMLLGAWRVDSLELGVRRCSELSQMKASFLAKHRPYIGWVNQRALHTTSRYL